MLTVTCVARPNPSPKLKKGHIRYKLKKAIEHAQNLCLNFEDTTECRIAWDEVDDLSRVLHDQKPDTVEPERSELSKRDYEI